MTRRTSFTGFTTLNAQLIAGLKADYPGAPGDYLKFLVEVGYGTLGSLTI